MTRVSTVKRGNPIVRYAHRAARRQFGRPVEPVGVYAHHPGLLFGYGLFEQATARLHGVEERLKVLAETRVASLVCCEYCIDIGSALARKSGVTEAQLLALPQYADSPEFGELERLVLDYASAMTRTPTEVDDARFARLREHFDDGQIVELTNVIALENMRSRFNSAVDMTPDGFSQGMVCALPEPTPA